MVRLREGRILLCQGKRGRAPVTGPRNSCSLPSPVLRGGAEQDSPRGPWPGPLRCVCAVTTVRTSCDGRMARVWCLSGDLAFCSPGEG